MARISKKHGIKNYGFGEHRGTAIDLLRETVAILAEFQITNCLISGTLLGQVRHNDIIPWDDDIDLTVSSSIFDVLPEMRQRYPHLIFICVGEKSFVKVCFRYRGYQIISKHDCDGQMVPVLWPFVDLFVFNLEDDHLVLFKKQWDKDKILPVKPVNFLGVETHVPADSDYFLSLNYGQNYMTELIKDGSLHKAGNNGHRGHIGGGK